MSLKVLPFLLAALVLCAQPSQAYADCDVEFGATDEGGWFEPGDGWWEAGAGWDEAEADQELKSWCSAAGVAATLTGFSNIFLDAVAAFCAAVTIYGWSEQLYADYLEFIVVLETQDGIRRFYEAYPDARWWLNY
jgi:hypothetical protein